MLKGNMFPRVCTNWKARESTFTSILCTSSAKRRRNPDVQRQRSISTNKNSKLYLSAGLQYKCLKSHVEAYFPLLHATSCISTVTENQRETTKNIDDIPMVPGKGIRAAYNAYMQSGEVHITTREITKQLGPIFRFELIKDMVFITDPNLIEQVIRQEGKSPIRSNFVIWEELRKKSGLGMGILMSNGDEWVRSRGVANRVLMNPRKIAASCPKIHEVTDDFIHRLRNIRKPTGNKANDKEGTVTINGEIHKWTLESMGNVLLDERLGTLDPVQSPKTKELIQTIHDFFEDSAALATMPPVFYKTIFYVQYRRLKRTQERLFGYAVSSLEKKIKELDTQPSMEDSKSILAQIIKTARSEKYHLDKKELYAALSELYLAAVDSTGNAIMFLLHEVSKREDIQEKLHEEILQVAPNGEHPDFDMLQKCPLLRACVKENLRIHSVGGGFTRILENETILSGYRIPANTAIIGIFHHMCRSDQYFESPDDYIPERWLRGQSDSNSDQLKSTHPYAYIPFGTGARMCIGRRFAELEMYIMLFQLIQKFRMVNTTPNDLVAVAKLFLSPKSDIVINFIDRK